MRTMFHVTGLLFLLVISGCATKVERAGINPQKVASANTELGIAYLGQGACCLYAEVPSTVTMEAWNLLDKEIYILFRENQTNVLLSFMNDKGNEILILRIVFHWKNKFQGIETPCLNIFDERYLTEDII